MRVACLAVALAVICLVPASAPTGRAESGPPLPTPAAPIAAPHPQSIDGRFAAAPSCREMTDGCRVCVRRADGAAACSLPGIACTPTGWRCKTGASGATDSGSGSGSE